MLQQTIATAHQTIADALIESARHAFADYDGGWKVTNEVVTCSGSFVNAPSVEQGQFVIGRKALGRKASVVFNGEDVYTFYPAMKDGKPFIMTECNFRPDFGHAEKLDRWFTPVSEFDIRQLI